MYNFLEAKSNISEPIKIYTFSTLIFFLEIIGQICSSLTFFNFVNFANNMKYSELLQNNEIYCNPKYQYKLCDLYMSLAIILYMWYGILIIYFIATIVQFIISYNNHKNGYIEIDQHDKQITNTYVIKLFYFVVLIVFAGTCYTLTIIKKTYNYTYFNNGVFLIFFGYSLLLISIMFRISQYIKQRRQIIVPYYKNNTINNID